MPKKRTWQLANAHECCKHLAFSSSPFRDHMICFVAPHGSLVEVEHVISKLSKPIVYAWNAIISAHVKLGEGERALEVYKKMEQEGVEPDKFTFSNILKACRKTGEIEVGSLIHVQIIKGGLDSDAVIGNALVDMYAKCGKLEQAHEVFTRLQCWDSVSWGAIISGYAANGNGLCALELFEKMHQEGVKPNKVMFLSVLKVSGKTGALEKGRLMHDQIVKVELDSEMMIGNTLIDMYAKCGSLHEATFVFDGLPNHDTVSYGAMIAGYVEHGHHCSAFELLMSMQKKGFKPSKVIYSCVLRACGSMRYIGQGIQTHDEIIRSQLESDLIIGNGLIDMYCKCGSLEDAQRVFDKLQKRDAVSWGAIVAGYAHHGYFLHVINFFEEMQKEGIKLNIVLILCILKACGIMRALEEGRLMHALILQHGLGSVAVVGNALVDMYAKCGSLGEAYKVFVGLLSPDVVSWGTMISGYTMHGHGGLAIELFCKMQQEGIKPDEYIFTCILKVCGNSKGFVKLGESIHAQIMRSGLGSDLAIGNTLIDMYAKCGSLDAARKIFNKLANRDVASWGAMIEGYCAHGYNHNALELSEQMKQEGTKVDSIIFSSLLKACIGMGIIGQGRLIHEQIIQSGLDSDLAIGSILVDMYAKCGILEEALGVFDELPNRDLLIWGAIIAGCAKYGNFEMVSQCLVEMQHSGLKPSDVVFTSILAACSQAGHLREGYRYFKSMRVDYGITPDVEQYSCMLDLLARAGCLKKAKDLLQTMPIPPDVIMWRALLAGCKIYGNNELGRQCLDQIIQFDPGDCAGYVLVSSIYGDGQMWEDYVKIQELRIHAGAWKKPGRAWIEIHDKVHEFTIGGASHVTSEGIYAKLKLLIRLLKEGGYVLQLDFILEEDLVERRKIACEGPLQAWL